MAGREKKLDVGALSAEEWSYIRGLFLADGNRHRYGNDFRVKFDLQGDEMGLARRVMELLRRAGLNPYAMKDRVKYMISVRADSVSLFNFLPDKKVLFSDAVAMRRFFDENDLFSVGRGMPFLAGLLDGDGCLWVHKAEEDGSCFGKLEMWRWIFAQSGEHKFLVEYVREFVEHFARGGVSLDKRLSPLVPFVLVLLLGPEPFYNYFLRILKSGIRALLVLGIARCSWKAERWLQEVVRIRVQRSRYLTTEKAGRMLGVGGKLVRKWVDSGEVKGVRRGNRRYVHLDEVREVRAKLVEERENMDRVKAEGVKLMDVAKMLRISRGTLHWWYGCGKLRATLVHERDLKYLVVPTDEVERLKKYRKGKREGRRVGEVGEKEDDAQKQGECSEGVSFREPKK